MTNEQRAQYFRAIFDAIPQPTFIVDADVAIRDFNTAAESLLGSEPAAALHRRGGEALHCLNSQSHGCGRAAECKNCVIRNSVQKALIGRNTSREWHQARLRSGDRVVALDLLVTTSLLPYTASPEVLLILEDVNSVARSLATATAAPRRSRAARAR
jgi:PAS domain-containing protein